MLGINRSRCQLVSGVIIHWLSLYLRLYLFALPWNVSTGFDSDITAQGQTLKHSQEAHQWRQHFYLHHQLTRFLKFHQKL